MNIKLSILLVLFSLIEVNAAELKGKVTAFGDLPLNMVEVSTKSGSKTLSDINGDYVIKVKDKDVVTFKAAGFTTRRIKIKEEQLMNVNLIFEENDSAKEKAIVNQHITAENLDHGLSTVGFTNYKYYEFSSIFEVLIREHPGIRIDESQGTPVIYLVNQGSHSLALNQAALLVVDGAVMQDISMILPTEVKEIKVLQGPDAAHWGSRSANGVIEISLVTGSN